MATLRNFITKRWKAVLFMLAAGPLLFFGPIVALDLVWDVGVYVLKKEGDSVRDKIEAYRSVHGALPPDLEAVGIPERMEGPIYYRREDDREYILWFGTTLGESVIYSSKTRQWDQ